MNGHPVEHFANISTESAIDLPNLARAGPILSGTRTMAESEGVRWMIEGLMIVGGGIFILGLLGGINPLA